MRKPQYQTIGVLIFGLAVVIVLIYYMSTFQETQNLIEQPPPLPADARVEISGLYYYNTLQNFSLKAPNDNWSIVVLTETSQLPEEDVTKTVLRNTFPLAEFFYSRDEDTLAVVQIGALQQKLERNVRDFAIQTLGEIIESYEVGELKVAVAKEVTVLTRRTPQGAYFMARLPEDSGEDLPVWVYAVYIDNGIAFTLHCRVAEAHYSELRFDFQSLIESFRRIARSREGSL